MTTSVGGPSFSNIPEEMQVAISQYLPAEDLAKAQGISKFAQALLAGEAVWQQIAENLGLPEEKGSSYKDRVIKYYEETNKYVFDLLGKLNQDRHERGLKPFTLPQAVDNPYQQQAILRKYLVANSFLLRPFIFDLHEKKRTLFLRLLIQDWVKAESSRALWTAFVKNYPIEVIKLIFESLPKDVKIDEFLLSNNIKFTEAIVFLLNQNIAFDLNHALYHAIIDGTPEVVKQLLQKGAIVVQPLIDAAKKRGNNEILALLEAAKQKQSTEKS